MILYVFLIPYALYVPSTSSSWFGFRENIFEGY